LEFEGGGQWPTIRFVVSMSVPGAISSTILPRSSSETAERVDSACSRPPPIEPLAVTVLWTRFGPRRPHQEHRPVELEHGHGIEEERQVVTHEMEILDRNDHRHLGRANRRRESTRVVNIVLGVIRPSLPCAAWRSLNSFPALRPSLVTSTTTPSPMLGIPTASSKAAKASTCRHRPVRRPARSCVQSSRVNESTLPSAAAHTHDECGNVLLHFPLENRLPPGPPPPTGTGHSWSPHQKKLGIDLGSQVNPSVEGPRTFRKGSGSLRPPKAPGQRRRQVRANSPARTVRAERPVELADDAGLPTPSRCDQQLDSGDIFVGADGGQTVSQELDHVLMARADEFRFHDSPRERQSSPRIPQFGRRSLRIGHSALRE